MQKAENYLTSKGWKADLEETVRDFKDVKILVKRAVGLFYPGSEKWDIELTSKEREKLTLIYNKLTLIYNKLTLIYNDNELIKYTNLEIPKDNYENNLPPFKR